METLTSNQAKTQFGDLLLKVQRAPIEISRNGKPVAVMISADDYSAMEPLKMELLRQSLKRGLADLAAGKTQDGDSSLASIIESENE
jgi:prevent-host-death family protein